MTATKTKKSVIAWIEVKTTDLLRAVEMALTFTEGRTSPIHDCVLIQLRHDKNDNTSALVVNKFDGSSWVRSLVPMIGASQNSHEFAIPARSLKDFLTDIAQDVDSVLVELSAAKAKITNGTSVKYELQVQLEAYPEPPSAGATLSQVTTDVIKLIKEGSVSVATGMEAQSVSDAVKASCDLIVWQGEDGTVKGSAFSASGHGLSLCDQGEIGGSVPLFQHNIAGGVADKATRLIAGYDKPSVYIGKIGNYLVIEAGTDDAYTQVFSLAVSGQNNRAVVSRAIPAQYIKTVVKIAELVKAIKIVSRIHEFCIMAVIPDSECIAIAPRIYSNEDAEVRVNCEVEGVGVELDSPQKAAVACDILTQRLNLMKQYGEKAVIKFRVVENAPPLLLIEPEAETVGRRLHLVIGAKNLGSRKESVVKESGK